MRMLYLRHPRVSAVHLLCAIMNKVCLVRIQKRTAGCGRELPVRWLSCALLECDQQQPASWHGNVPRALPGSVLKIGSPEVRRLGDPTGSVVPWLSDQGGLPASCVPEGVKPLPFPKQAEGAVTGKQIRKRPSSEPQTLSVKTAHDLSPFPGWGRRSPERLSGTGSHAVSRRQVCLNLVLTSFTEASAAVPDARSSGLEF